MWLYPLCVWSIDDLDHNYTSRASLYAYQHIGMVQMGTDGNVEITWKVQSEVLGNYFKFTEPDHNESEVPETTL